ncbi:hypothetical protein CP533_2229 [Ophiocordyceps camponoti-saundersi (nom. inval.)]|nr:hypothetical protein CP533_2229 [Ophiocordyceps camponoti-saundersi (nom. inval.)]
MAPKATPTKANYKTYEAQARLVRAMVAAHPDVRWNYKEIAACMGSDVSENAINHRFRPIRAQASIVRQARGQGIDIKDMLSQEQLPTTLDAIDEKNIAKYFGQSTADGMQFQFRTIKRDAEALRKTEAEGGDVATCLTEGLTSATPTPSRPTPSRRGAKAATGRGGGGAGGGGAIRKRGRATKIKKASSDDDDGDDDDDDETSLNWDARDVTPSKRARTTPTQKTVLPRRAALKASVTIADAAAQLSDSLEPEPEPKPKIEVAEINATGQRSIFGPFVNQINRLTPGLDDDDDGYGDGEI